MIQACIGATVHIVGIRSPIFKIIYNIENNCAQNNTNTANIPVLAVTKLSSSGPGPRSISNL